MAAGLPVVAPAIDRIPNLIGHNSEGLLYDTGIRRACRMRLKRWPIRRSATASVERRANAPFAITAGRRTVVRWIRQSGTPCGRGQAVAPTPQRMRVE